DAEPDFPGHDAVHGHPGGGDFPAVCVPGNRPVAAYRVVPLSRIRSCRQLRMLQTLEVAYGPRTSVVRLPRPGVRNALAARLIAELPESFMALGDGGEGRAIVLPGGGEAFCAAADQNAMRHSAQAGEADNPAHAQAMATLLHTV